MPRLNVLFFAIHGLAYFRFYQILYSIGLAVKKKREKRGKNGNFGLKTQICLNPPLTLRYMVIGVRHLQVKRL
jgi:hypothetical protein